MTNKDTGIYKALLADVERQLTLDEGECGRYWTGHVTQLMCQKVSMVYAYGASPASLALAIFEEIPTPLDPSEVYPHCVALVEVICACVNGLRQEVRGTIIDQLGMIV